MSLRFANKVITAKIEAAYGTDATPAGADAMLSSQFTLNPLVGDRNSRELDRPNLGASPVFLSQLRTECSFRVDLSGSGTVDTPPAYAPLLRACGFNQTITAATDVQFDPASADGDSVSLYFNLSGRLHKLLGARGSVGFEFAAGQLPAMVFNFVGLLVAAADVAQVTPVYTAFQDPLQVNRQNTPTFTIHGHAGVLRDLRVEPGQVVGYRNWVNQEAVRISDRNYAGQLSILAPTLAAFDYDAAVRDETLGPLQLVHGTVAGNIVQLDATNTQITGHRDENDQGDVVEQMDILLTASDAGDDELKLTTK